MPRAQSLLRRPPDPCHAERSEAPGPRTGLKHHSPNDLATAEWVPMDIGILAHAGGLFPAKIES